MNRKRMWGVVFVLVGALVVSVAAPLAAQEKKEEAKAEKKEEKKKEGLPLEPERKIEFTTDEGTWLSLDAAPDGKTLVFELLGDLYTLPIEGGPAKRITSGLAFDSQPRFSPDGQWLAFLSDRDGAENLWIAKADGSEPKKLSKDENAELASPTWTPDGQYVIVSRSTWGLRTYELWMYHVKGGSGVQITKAKARDDQPNAERHNALGVVASPDGKYLYYARKRGGFQYNTSFPLWQIARRDQVSGDEDTLVQAAGSALRPLVSPDGRWLVYGTRYETQTGFCPPGPPTPHEPPLHPRPPPRLRLPPRRPGNRPDLRRQAPPREPGDRPEPRDSFHGGRGARPGPAAQLPPPGRSRPGARPHHPRPDPVARRPAPGVFRAHQALRHGPADGKAPAADQQQRPCPERSRGARVPARLVARRAVARLRHLVG